MQTELKIVLRSNSAGELSGMNRTCNLKAHCIRPPVNQFNCEFLLPINNVTEWTRLKPCNSEVIEVTTDDNTQSLGSLTHLLGPRRYGAFPLCCTHAWSM